MLGTVEVQYLVETIMEAARRGTDASLRAGGVAMPPQVHLLVEEWENPYVGYLTCRPILHARDITPALRGFGIVASLIGASRVVVAWENHNLWSEVDEPDASNEPYGHVAVDVHRDGGHVLRWHPFEPRPARAGRGGWGSPVVPVWGDPVVHRDGDLPISVGILLWTWRDPAAAWGGPTEWDPAMRTAVLDGLEEDGYRMHWMRPDPRC